MAARILVDSDILIDAARGESQAVDFLDSKANECSVCLSCISHMELIVGCRNKRELAALDKFMQRFEVVQIDYVCSSTATDLLKTYRLSHGLLIPDALIAGAAMALGVEFFTKNRKHYRFIPGLHLGHYS